MNRFNKYLQNLGFSSDDLKERQGNVFSYKLGIGKPVTYIYTASNDDIFSAHKKYWNSNSVNIFIAVSNEKTFIINSKQQPNKENPVSKQIAIKSFDYGINSEGFENINVKEITKDYIDSTYFFDFIIKLTANKKTQEVDKHLLLNLIAIRNDLLKIEDDDKTIHLLILRSLFIKYLEDKQIYPKNYWTDILKTNSPEKVLNAFVEIKRINGNIFDEELPVNKIRKEYLQLLHRFFISDYRSGQQSLFPYLFDKIPVQLISHVYEAFLKSKDKKGKGIYYTPAYVVNFMLSHSLADKLLNNNKITILDPAVGSGAFLVESLKMIFQNNPKLTYEQKKDILQNQLFGIDIDRKALQIAAFSLYLTLIETEDPKFIREQIENAHPILPSLIGENLICANALTDEVFTDRTFDCILSNPPWGAVEPNNDKENIKERKAINTKGQIGTMPEYKNVSDYERSQAFLVRVKKWSNENTIFALIVKNSIFLNDNSEDFRKELLETYQINSFYELSNYNKILFKKQTIGEINGVPIELGASEPCAVLIFELPKNENHTIKYISPKLNGFSENFQLIHYTQKDINVVEQKQFIEDDLLWRVLVNGDFEDYKLIKTLYALRDNVNIICSKGFEPKKTDVVGEPEYRALIKSEDFNQYQIIKNLSFFNWNQELRRKGNEDLYNGRRILIATRPKPNDNFLLRSILVDKEILFRNDIFGFKVDDGNLDIALAFLNSKLAGYILFNISVQWFAGYKREALRVAEIKSLPYNFSNNNIKTEIQSLVSEYLKKGLSSQKSQIDELVFDLYDLTLYQKEIIREFYQIRVERADNKLKYVQRKDIEIYIEEFAKSFNLMLQKGSKLVGKYKISTNVGAVVCFTIVDEKDEYQPTEDKTLEILHFVKRKQISDADRNKLLNEDKVQIYDNEFMYIIKSNLFKDWTIRQAMRDARDEIHLIVNNLPEA